MAHELDVCSTCQGEGMLLECEHGLKCDECDGEEVVCPYCLGGGYVRDEDCRCIECCSVS